MHRLFTSDAGFGTSNAVEDGVVLGSWAMLLATSRALEPQYVQAVR